MHTVLVVGSKTKTPILTQEFAHTTANILKQKIATEARQLAAKKQPAKYAMRDTAIFCHTIIKTESVPLAVIDMQA